MKRIMGGLTLLTLAGLLFAMPAAGAASDEQALVERARLTIGDLRHDKEFGNSLSLIKQARAVMIVPRLYKAGFFVGGEGGDGLLLTRAGADGWTGPAFYTLASASFGLQIGAQESELIMFVLTQKGLDALMRDKFTIGAEAGIAIVTLGSSAEAATTANLKADIVVWASSSGAYAGISLNGSVVAPRESFDRGYYGHDVTSSDILLRRSVSNPGASGLREALAKLG